MVITLSGQGSCGENGGPNGDVQLYVQVRPDRNFRRDGLNLRCDNALTFGKAALGGEIVIDRFGEQIKINIPAGTQTGTTFRVPKKGFKNVRGENFGDLYVTVKVETPRKLTDRQKELLAEFDAIENDRKKNSFKEKVKNAFNL